QNELTNHNISFRSDNWRSNDYLHSVAQLQFIADTTRYKIIVINKIIVSYRYCLFILNDSFRYDIWTVEQQFRMTNTFNTHIDHVLYIVTVNLTFTNNQAVVNDILQRC